MGRSRPSETGRRGRDGSSGPRHAAGAATRSGPTRSVARSPPSKRQLRASPAVQHEMMAACLGTLDHAILDDGEHRPEPWHRAPEAAALDEEAVLDRGGLVAPDVLAGIHRAPSVEEHDLRLGHLRKGDESPARTVTTAPSGPITPRSSRVPDREVFPEALLEGTVVGPPMVIPAASAGSGPPWPPPGPFTSAQDTRMVGADATPDTCWRP